MTSIILEKIVAACSELISEKIKQVIESERKVLLDEVLNIRKRLEATERHLTGEVSELISAEFGRLSEVRIVISKVLDHLRKTGYEFDFYWHRFSMTITSAKLAHEAAMSRFLSPFLSSNFQHSEADNFRRDMNIHFHQLRLSLSRLLDVTKKREGISEKPSSSVDQDIPHAQTVVVPTVF